MDPPRILPEPEELEPEETGLSGPVRTSVVPSTASQPRPPQPHSSTAPSTNTWRFYASKAADFKTGDKRSLLTCSACARVFPNLFICQMSLVFTEEFLLISPSHSAPGRCACHWVNIGPAPSSQNQRPLHVCHPPQHPPSFLDVSRLVDTGMGGVNGL